MPKKISEEQRILIIELIGAGWTREQIAEKCGVSVRTVSSIKNGMTAEQVQSSREQKALFKYTSLEDKYISKIEKEQALFEDPEEGWVYHITKEQLATQGSSRWWMGIAYPESAENDWIDRLRMLGCELAISPLHDKDLWNHDSPPILDEESGEILIPEGDKYKIGDRKKSHWHFILKFDNAISFREINNLIRPITKGPYLQKCRSPKQAYEYFIHLNNPEKYQYEKDEIQEFNKFRIEPNRVEVMYMLQDIFREIREAEIDSMLELTRIYANEPEYLLIIATKAYPIGRLLDENWRKHNPGYAKKVEIVGGNATHE